MANVFDKVIDFLNKPLPGTAKKDDKKDAKAATKPAAKAEAKKPATPVEQKARDIQTELRKRELQLKRQQAKAAADERKKVIAERAKLRELRRQYEQEVAKQAEAHAKTEDWTHTVVPGDTLSGIAKKYYGDASRWPEIHAANKDRIKNPNLIYPGQTFIIPDADED